MREEKTGVRLTQSHSESVRHGWRGILIVCITRVLIGCNSALCVCVQHTSYRVKGRINPHLLPKGPHQLYSIVSRYYLHLVSTSHRSYTKSLHHTVAFFCSFVDGFCRWVLSFFCRCHASIQRTQQRHGRPIQKEYGVAVFHLKGKQNVLQHSRGGRNFEKTQ